MRSKKVYWTLLIIVVLLNAANVFWYLAFAHTITAVILNVLLVVFFINEFLRGKAPINIIVWRSMLLVVFILISGIATSIVQFKLFFGSYELVYTEIVCEDSLQPCEDGIIRLEYFEQNGGLYDTNYKTEKVTPFLYLFEWRKVIATPKNGLYYNAP